MEASVYEYWDYKKYIADKIATFPNQGRGVRQRLASAIGCQTAFVSQVLRQAPHFSLEQGVRINRFFGHSKDEGRFFLLLLERAKAGSQDLQKHFDELIGEVLQKRHDLSRRLSDAQRVPEELQHVYYSAWYYAAVHVSLSIPKLQTPEALAAHLDLPRDKVVRVLEFLVQAGLAVVREGRYGIGTKVLHLSRESPHIHRHHGNWRNQALISIDRELPEDLHYSNVVTVARKDVPLIREELIRAIEKFRGMIEASSEETVQVLTLDFFGLRSG